LAELTQSRIPVILNPKARSEAARSTAEQVAGFSCQVEIHETGAPLDAKRIARELAEADFPLIVAAGGDGTINEVVSGITAAQQASHGEIQPTLGVLPFGTMNVFARELGIPRNDPPAAWAVIQSGLTAEIDLWLANDTPFIQMAGVGLDAEIIRQTTWKSKKFFGPFSYLLTGLRMVGQARPKLRIEIPGHDEPLNGSTVVIGNGCLYGGSLPFFPGASNRDGRLDILLFRELNTWVLLQLGLAVASNERCRSRRVVYERAEEFTVTSVGASEAPFEVDGEYVGQTPISFRKAGRPLRVAVPADPAPRSLPELAEQHFSS